MAPASPRSALNRASPFLIGAGVIVIAAGFGLPRLVPDSPPPAPAPAVTKAPAVPEGPGLGTSLARLVGSLVVVCGLCVAVTRFVNRQSVPAKSSMDVVASLPVDGRCTVYLVKAGDRRLLLGIDPGGVKALVELPGPPPEPEPEPIMEATAPAASEAVVIGPVAVAAPPTADEIAAIIEKLRQVAQK